MKLRDSVSTIADILANIEKPQTNDAATASAVYSFAIFKALSTLAKPFDTSDEIKRIYSSQLGKENSEITLFDDSEIRLLAKITKPRASFDKSQFIRAISEKYNISAGELLMLATQCEKLSSAPITLTTVVK